jgi:hypothetical protein
MTRTTRADSKGQRRFSNKQLAIISIALASIIILASLITFGFFQVPAKFSLRAALVDQLGSQFPNETFKETTLSMLIDAGFNVSYYRAEDVNVTFYKELANRNYGIIILRSHSALREDGQTVDLFTSEEYDKDKYSWEQRNGLLTKGNYSFEPSKFYFAITSKFLDNLAGRFPKSIIIAMGCWSLKLGEEDLAKAFIGKGAVAYFGWSNVVLPADTDVETTNLLELIFKENMTLASAANEAKIYTYQGDGETVQSRLNLYPPSSWNIKVSQLIEEAQVAEAPKTSSDLIGSFSLVTDVAVSKLKVFLID